MVQVGLVCHRWSYLFCTYSNSLGFTSLPQERYSFPNWTTSHTVKHLELEIEHLKRAQKDVQHVSLHSRSNWNLAVLVFEERGKPEYPEKNLSDKGGNKQQTQPTYEAGKGNRTRATFRWEASALTTTPPAPAPLKVKPFGNKTFCFRYL